MTPRERVIQVLLRILARPYRYTKRDLAEHFGYSKDTIDEDIQAIKASALDFHQDHHHRCAILPSSQFDELRYLQFLTKKERAKIGQVLDKNFNDREAFYLKNKLSSLYDFQQLGLNALRRPALERLNQLEFSKTNKKQVVLENYRSNSNDIRDRIAEVFDIDAALDTIQALDPTEENKEKRIKHFKLSRIERVRLTNQSWQHEDQHNPKPTDVFRIAMANQVLVRLKIDVFAYNSLIDNYPKAKGACMPGAIPNTFDFQTKVNPEFLGLTNFIMNNTGHVEIISPPSLIEKVKEKATILLESLS